MLRPRILIALLFSCLSLTGCYLFGRPPDIRIQVPSDFLAVTHAGMSRSTAEYSLLGMLNAKMTRIDFSWNVIEPQQGTFDFSTFDAVVAAAATNGIEVLAILDYDVPWIHPDGQMHYVVPPDRMQDWLTYVSTVVTRYAGQVRAYEIWNEPNGTFWQGTVDQFASLTKQTAAAIRAADPSALVVGGAFLHDPRDWARAMIAAGAFQNVDAMSFHPYAGTPDQVAQMSDSFMSDVRAMGYGGAFWVTEVGYTTAGIYPWTVPDGEYPTVAAETMTLLTVSGVQKVVWYTIADTYMPGQQPAGLTSIQMAEAYFGLAYPDFSPKSGAYAYQAVASVVQGSTFETGLVVNDAEFGWIRVYPFILADGRVGVVAWANMPGKIQLSESLTWTTLGISGPGTGSFSGQNVVLSGTPLVLVTATPVDSSHLKIRKVAF